MSAVRDALEWLGGWIRASWLTVLMTAALAYFAFHAVHGQRGILAWVDKSRELEALKHTLLGLDDEHATLARRITGLRPDHLDRDQVEEELRKLGYVAPDEVIVLRPPTSDGTP